MSDTKLTINADDYQSGGNHYIEMEISPWSVIDTWPIEQRIGFYRGCALKYIMRMGSKDTPSQEARKSAHCITKLAEILENRVSNA